MKNKKQQKKKVSTRDLTFDSGVKVNGLGEGKLGFKYVPAAQGRSVKTNQPRQQSIGMNNVVVHREYIADVIGNPDFTNQVYPINPGLAGVFPWLSGIASNYEEYKIKRMSFVYETQASTMTPGTVMLAIDYDPADSPPQDKSHFMTMAGAVRTPSWAAVKCSTDPSRRPYTPLFIRNTPLDDNLDIKTYDYGVLNIATQGFQDYTLCGELYVEYEVILMTPQQDVNTDLLSRYTYVSTGNGSNNGFPFNNNTTSYGLMKCVFTGNTIMFPSPGSYRLLYRSTNAIDIASTSNVYSTEVVIGAGNIGYSSCNKTSGNGYCNLWFEVEIVTPGTTVQFSFGWGAAGVTWSYYLEICPIQNANAPGPALSYRAVQPGAIMTTKRPSRVGSCSHS